MGEAENWSRLSREKPRAENSKKIDSGNSGGFARAIGKIPGLILTQQTLHEKRSREMYVGQPVK
jgi:hypothetical protein